MTAQPDNLTFSGLGISLPLFVVGLKLDLYIIRAFGPVSLATGLGQVFFTSVVGFFLALALGMAVVPVIYVTVALTFSSTIIIVKPLSDKKETDTLHGRIAIGRSSAVRYRAAPLCMFVTVLVHSTAPGRGLGKMVWLHVGMAIKAATTQISGRKRRFIRHHPWASTPLRARMFDKSTKDGFTRPKNHAIGAMVVCSTLSATGLSRPFSGGPRGST